MHQIADPSGKIPFETEDIHHIRSTTSVGNFQKDRWKLWAIKSPTGSKTKLNAQSRRISPNKKFRQKKMLSLQAD